MMRKALVSTLLLVACGGGGDKKLDTPDECNPLGGGRCMTPWPSAIYEKDDATSATGRRIDLQPGTLPTNIDGIAIEPAPYNKKDGFSPAAAIVTAFPT